MRRFVTGIGFAVGLAATARPAAWAEQVSAFQTGNSLLSLCQGSGETLGACWGYFEGISDLLSSYPEVADHFRICQPLGLTAQQVHDIGLKFILVHPEARHLTATSMMLNALREAFPCGK